MSRKIIIKVDKNGKVHIDFEGYHGEACIIDRNKIIELLQKYGIKLEVESEELKPEYYFIVEKETTKEKEKVIW